MEQKNYVSFNNLTYLDIHALLVLTTYFNRDWSTAIDNQTRSRDEVVIH